MSGTRISDRRCGSRLQHAEEHGIHSARVRLGQPAAVVNASATGVLLDTTSRLLPGSAVDVQLEGGRHRATCRGHVVRCSVIRLRPATICYRAAIFFEQPLPWFADDASTGYSLPGLGTCALRPGRVATTHSVL